ncbi:acetylserotonin O-methyltransferase [Sorex fumeus]|uniref:acetylserotonin O-methyltransferase n=1 Tax=Sorex fumeus TaxID=62283 RepID=UPI0024AE4AB2|nr:acetylserotonin O-methyltransferase [Sorex fumeus]
MDSAGLDAGYEVLSEYAHGFMVSQVLFAACDLGIFDLLAETPEPLDAATVAARLGTSARGTGPLLDTCVSLKLLTVRTRAGVAVYSNGPLASTYLVSSSPYGQRHMVQYLGSTTYRCWTHLGDAVREGRNQYHRAFGVAADQLFSAIYRTSAERVCFLRGLQEVWAVHGRRLLTAFDLTPFRTVCDLGGGSGALARLCVSLYPACTATVLDIPEVVDTARMEFSRGETEEEEEEEDDRVSFRAGDFFRDPLPEADLFLLARVLHDWTDARCSQLLAGVFRSCRAGGGVLVIEGVLDADGRGPLTTQLFSLNMLVQTEGQERTLAQYTQLLEAAGFRRVAHRHPGGPYHAVLARK